MSVGWKRFWFCVVKWWRLCWAGALVPAALCILVVLGEVNGGGGWRSTLAGGASGAGTDGCLCPV